MKEALFFVYLFFVFFQSCGRKDPEQKEKTSGKINTISVIIDDPLWNGEIGDTIRNKFACPVIGLPQEEPLFTINQFPLKLLEGYMTNSRNIIVIKKASENRFEIVKNEYASPQNVIHISGKSTPAILEIIEEQYSQIVSTIRQTEIEENQRMIDTATISTKKIRKKFKVDLKIPKGYQIVLQRRKFIWLKKEITSGNTSLLIYQVPVSAIKNNTSVVRNIIRVRDSVGRLYIRGRARNTPMVTEDSYAPYLFKVSFMGKEAYETRGTWELKNDYMSGPFINYSILDRTNKRMLVLEGFCYDPSKEKRDLMFELEAIIKSLAFIKKESTTKK